MKNTYKKPMLSVLYFEDRDLITESPSDFDGTGTIPDSWWIVS